MVRSELERIVLELVQRLAPQLQANPMATILLGQLRNYLRTLSEEQAREIARMIVGYAKRLENALEPDGLEPHPKQR